MNEIVKRSAAAENRRDKSGTDVRRKANKVCSKAADVVAEEMYQQGVGGG